MSDRARIGIVLAPPYHPGSPSGGAEAIADQVASALSQDFSVVVAHGYQQERKSRQLGRRLQALSAFPLEGEALTRGEVSLTSLSDEAATALRECAIVFQFERVLRGLEGPLRFAVIGGMAYRHCLDCFSSSQWDELIVPSAFVRDFAIRECGADPTRTRVLPNGIDGASFAPAPTPSTRKAGPIRLLVAARPDPGKGYDEALAFKRACALQGHEVEIICFRQRSPFEQDDFFSRFESGPFTLTPWRPRAEMPAHYRDADLTLCLGRTPEGFGLSAVESLACGTPVLASPIGALPHLVPSDHGLLCADANQLSGISRDLETMLPRLRQAALERGSPFVHRTYSETAMIEAYQALAERAVRTMSAPA
jgi:glycosyltransferase involved in cell wall biosynthesis